MTDYNKCEIIDIRVFSWLSIVISWWSNDIYWELYTYANNNEYLEIQDYWLHYENDFIIGIKAEIPLSELNKLNKYIHNLYELFDTLEYTWKWNSELSLKAWKKMISD